MELKHRATIEFSMPEPFNFELTVHKPAGWHWSTPAEIFNKSIFWSGIFFDGKPIGLKMQSAGLLVRADIFNKATEKMPDLSRLEKQLYKALGADEDLAGFYEFAKSEPVLDEVVTRLRGMRMGRNDNLFGQVILAICLQMTPLKRSRQMMGLLLKEFGTQLHFDKHQTILWPCPEDIARLSPALLREKARLGYRAERLLAAAKYLVKKPVAAQQLDALPDKEARKLVMEIPGIGGYSAGIILGRSEVPVDSWSLIILSELIYGKSPVKGRSGIPALNELINKRWGKWGWLAFAYIVNDLPFLARKYHLSRIY